MARRMRVWTGTEWVDVISSIAVDVPEGGGGATGGGTDEVFYENDTVITTDYTITEGKNAGTFGPVTIDSGVTVTIPSGSVWTVV